MPSRLAQPEQMQEFLSAGGFKTRHWQIRGSKVQSLLPRLRPDPIDSLAKKRAWHLFAEPLLLLLTWRIEK